MGKSFARMGKGRKGKGTTKGQPQAASAGRKGKGTTKGQPQAASAGKGATKGQPQASSAEGGGDGRGGKWRMPGTRGFLKNHRKLLTHIAKQAKIEFDQAASAYEEAQNVFREAKTPENQQKIREAGNWVNNRELNMDWVALKWKPWTKTACTSWTGAPMLSS